MKWSVVDWFFQLLRSEGGSIECKGDGSIIIKLGKNEATYDGTWVSTEEAMCGAIEMYFRERP